MFLILTVLCLLFIQMSQFSAVFLFCLLLNCGISLWASQTGFRCVEMTLSSSPRLVEHTETWERRHWHVKANLQRNVLVPGRHSLIARFQLGCFIFRGELAAWDARLKELSDWVFIGSSALFLFICPGDVVNYCNHSMILQLQGYQLYLCMATLMPFHFFDGTMPHLTFD